MRKVVIFSCIAAILLLGVVGLLIAGAGTASETEATKAATTESTVPHEETQPTSERNTGGYVEPLLTEPLHDMYVRYYTNAPLEKKDEMKAYRGPFGGEIRSYPRQIRIIAGELTEDVPRLTLEQAEAIIQEVLSRPADGQGVFQTYETIITARFRRIAEIDFYGGSGISYTYFCLNDAMTQYIELSGASVRYHDTQAGICILMCWYSKPEEFTSVLELIRRGEVPPIEMRTQEKTKNPLSSGFTQKDPP